MQYLIDTVVLGQYLRGRTGAIALVRPILSQAYTSILVYAELVEYIRGLQNTSQWYRKLRLLMRDVKPIQLTYSIGDKYADLRRVLRPTGQLIGDTDLFIAATALIRQMTLVTADSDFNRVPGLATYIVPRNSLN